MLLLLAAPLVAADVPISVQMYTSTDCTGNPTVEGVAAEALTDAQTLSGESHVRQTSRSDGLVDYCLAPRSCDLHLLTSPTFEPCV